MDWILEEVLENLKYERRSLELRIGKYLEYKENVPDDFKIVWEYASRKDIRDKNGIQKKTAEVLIKYF